MDQATAGRQVYVFVHPDDNYGQDYAPATITHVVSDGKGEPPVVHLDALVGGERRHIKDVPLLADVDAAHEHLAADYEALLKTPGARDSEGKAKWPRHDAYRWVTAAYWPPRAASASAKKATAPKGDQQPSADA